MPHSVVAPWCENLEELFSSSQIKPTSHCLPFEALHNLVELDLLNPIFCYFPLSTLLTVSKVTLVGFDSLWFCSSSHSLPPSLPPPRLPSVSLPFPMSLHILPSFEDESRPFVVCEVFPWLVWPSLLLKCFKTDQLY